MSNHFNEATLEAAIINLLEEQGYPHYFGHQLDRPDEETVLLRDDLTTYLRTRYRAQNLTDREIAGIIHELEHLPASDLYGSNREVMRLVTNGRNFVREDPRDDNFYLYLLDFPGEVATDFTTTASASAQLMNVSDAPIFSGVGDANVYRFVTQLKITATNGSFRIPDGILYVNGLPLVVFEFKSTVREEATIHDGFVQIQTRYGRDIPQLIKYNAFCVISDGPNTKAGSFFAPYEFYYAWRRVDKPDPTEHVGDQLFTLIRGMLDKDRLRDIIHDFIFLPDTAPPDLKILCRYPQYYAARALYANILRQLKPRGEGKGGTYFGATGCGKSYTMLFLTRLLMRSQRLNSPTIVLITDRTDLDDQLSAQFTNAKEYIGDRVVKTVISRNDLRDELAGRASGGVFLTTIHKFNEDTELLSERTNVICISDEAHRSQVNLEQKVVTTKDGVFIRYGFAKHLHDSLPNATFVGFTGTPIDATLDVFGPVVDSYTMTESVRDEITVRIVREGRAAKVLLEGSVVQKMEDYYAEAAAAGASEYQVEASKKATSGMNAILGDPSRLKALAEDFVEHYERRVEEGSTVLGKAMFVTSNRHIAYDLYKEIIAIRTSWADRKTNSNTYTAIPTASELSPLSSSGEGPGERATQNSQTQPVAFSNLVMTRGKDDPKELYNLLGTKAYRKTLDTLFKDPTSNFKIAIVVDMWLTGFDVPELDTIYIDKPIQHHNLIQTISRVNRKLAGKERGLVVDYIGIKTQMNLALAMFSKADGQNIEDVNKSIVAVRDFLDLLRKFFHGFDTKPYYAGTPLEKLRTLNAAVEFAMATQKREHRYMQLVKRLKAAYDVCSGSGVIRQDERNELHFFLAVRAIIAKLTRGDAPDTAMMNEKVREMMREAIASDGVEELFTIDGTDGRQDIFSDEYLERIKKIKLPNTKVKLLQKLLAQAIAEFKKVNRLQGTNFSEKLRGLVERYNDRTENDTYVGDVIEEMSDSIIDLYQQLTREMNSFGDMGIDFEEKAFYDILLQLSVKYDFTYPLDRMLDLAEAMKVIVDDKVRYEDWSERADIKAELKVSLVLLLAEFKYPPITNDDVYQKVFEQVEGYKMNRR
ncbi:type I restriction endonuclease subunit R [Neolewinella antarctica]|uniref:Type I restriction enzyme endonuclease subunit n=1 Tax=Neolewinella antarctica TaxID=442734 RepID=A0ABX0XA66_9BACT|nr:HsdR family type I site-specific deoxyribonuclease [Neolewinella antarctica]NJC25682.1 type I restriction enzyme R subunit [Neolewinella antarctica]